MVLAGGVLVGALNIYLTASLLPTVVQDIGGERLYAWTATVFLSGQVVATMLVSQLLSRCGNVRAYLIGFGVFAIGSVVCAVSPTMAVMLVGRGAQGVGAGLLTGLGFSLIHSTLPRHLWARGSALVSAMFGVGNLIGPAVGGVFAQFGSWRLAFAALAVVAIVLASFVPRILPPGNRDNESQTPVALLPLGLVLAAVAAFSVAGVVRSGLAMALCIAMAIILVVTFIVTERHARQPILPTSTYRPGYPLPWIYLTIFFLASGVSVETFLPLFGQQLGNLQPAAAGMFAAVLSLGWSVSQLVSSSAHRIRTVRRLQVAGPAILTAAFAALTAMQIRDASIPVVIGWAAALLIGGIGIGIAMPHLSVAAMASNDVPAEADKAGAAIATVLTMSTTFGSALAGLLVNLGASSAVASARHLLLGFAGVAALGIVTAVIAVQRESRAGSSADAAATAPDRGDPDRRARSR